MSDVDEAFARSGCAVPGDQKLNAHNRLVWRDAWAAAMRELRKAQGEPVATVEEKRIVEHVSLPVGTNLYTSALDHP